MQLPDLTVPLSLPFGVPTLAHPAVVHFAIALPVVVLIVELANLMFKRRSLSLVSLGLLLLAVLVYLGAYFSGKADGKAAFDLLGDEAREALKTHRLLGVYLFYALLLPLGFKLLAMLLRQKWARGALIVSLVMFISFMDKQGYDGGELVYRYGVNVAATNEARESLDEARETIEDMNGTIAEQNETITALQAEVARMKAETQKGFGESVNEAVNEAVSKVKAIFAEENATAEQTGDANASSGASADTNETNGSR